MLTMKGQNRRTAKHTSYWLNMNDWPVAYNCSPACEGRSADDSTNVVESGKRRSCRRRTAGDQLGISAVSPPTTKTVLPVRQGRAGEGDIWIKESGYGRAGLETGVEFRLVKANWGFRTSRQRSLPRNASASGEKAIKSGSYGFIFFFFWGS